MINFIILITIFLCFGMSVPIAIMSRLKTNYNDIKTPKVGLKVLFLIIYTIVFYFFVYIGFKFYWSTTFDISSGLCRNHGGFIYTCPIDNLGGALALLLILIIVIVYTILCKKIIYELFINDYKIIKYVITVLYFIFLMLVFIYFDFTIIRGIMISYYFEIDVLNCFRYFVGLSPILIFPFLVYRDYIFKKDLFVKGER